MSVPAQNLAKLKWAARFFGLDGPAAEKLLRPLAPPPPADGQRTVEGLDLASAPGAAPTVSVAALAALRKQIDTLRAETDQLKRPDPEAEGAEWADVARHCAKVEKTAARRELTPADIQAAQKDRDDAKAARTLALEAIQKRLGEAADKILERLAPHAAHPDATPDEWKDVVAACDTVRAALAGRSTRTLTKAALATAEERWLLVAPAAATATQAIRTRLDAEAKQLRDQLPALRTPDPDALGSEWQAVLDACKAVESALPASPGGAQVADATVKLGEAKTASQVAVTAIRKRLTDAAQALNAQLTTREARPAEFEAPEWARVVQLCKSGRDALAVKELHNADIDIAQAALDEANRAKTSAEGLRRARFQRQAKRLVAPLETWRTPEDGLDPAGWGPVLEALEEIDAAVPKLAEATPEAVSEVKRRVDEFAVRVQPALQASWVALCTRTLEEMKAFQGQLKFASDTHRKYFQEKVAPQLTELKAFNTRLKEPPTVANRAELRAQVSRLQASRLQARETLQRLAQGIDPAKDADDLRQRVTVRAGVEAARARLQLEMAAMQALSDRLKTEVPFAEFEPAIKKLLDEMKEEVRKELVLYLPEFLKPNRGWGYGSEFQKAESGEPYNHKHVTEQIANYETILAKAAEKRAGYETRLDQWRASYGGTDMLPSQREQLECLASALRGGLSKAVAEELQKQLEAAKAPVEIWRVQLQTRLTAQLTAPLGAEVWAARFGIGAGKKKGDSWGIDNKGTVGGKNVHLTFYTDSPACSIQPEAKVIVDTVLRTGTRAVHVTKEVKGYDNPDNPKLYRGGSQGKVKLSAGETVEMQALLDGFEADCVKAAQGYKDRLNLNSQEHTARLAKLAEVEGKIASL